MKTDEQEPKTLSEYEQVFKKQKRFEEPVEIYDGSTYKC